jgi:hypothetical protein
MTDKPKIVAGIIVVVVVLTFPFWYALASGRTSSPPELAKPAGQCLEDVEFMKAHHVDLLKQWREAVVRDGQKMYPSTHQGACEMSLTKTCLGCHTNRANFCDRCHNYADVHPTCWDCHVDAKGK